MKSFSNLFCLLLVTLFLKISSINSAQPVTLSILSDRLSIYALQDAVTAYRLVDPNVEIQLGSGGTLANINAITQASSDAATISLSLGANIALANPTLFTLPLLAVALTPSTNK